MTNSNISRRSFLKKAGKTSGFVVLAGGVVQLTSFNAWAAKKSAIDNHVAKTMLLVGKDMFPGLKSMEGEGFFNTMRGEMVNVFFNNPRVWAVAGWEGASYDKGGYYLRGFQDADWPQPPEDASPKGWWE